MAIYEAGSIAAFIAALFWVLRSRNPVNLGALIGGFMIFGFDWLWCGKGFFNLLHHGCWAANKELRVLKVEVGIFS